MPRIVEPSAELLSCTALPERLIERAGRTSYKSEDKITEDSAGAFITKLLNRGHTSVIEHAVATIKFVTDRGVSHELVRHRIGSYTQESTRYCNYSRDKYNSEITVIRPPTVRINQQEAVWWDAVCAAEKFYFKLLSENVKPEIARSVLPNSLKTEIATTFNFREWMHFLKLRMAKNAHPQIRQIAYFAWKLLLSVSPVVFAEFRSLADAILDDDLVTDDSLPK